MNRHYSAPVLELLGAAGLVLPQFRRLAGICLLALLVGMFIANVNAARRHTARRTANPALVAGSGADFVYCAILMVNSRVNGVTHRQADSKNCLICTQYLLTT